MADRYDSAWKAMVRFVGNPALIATAAVAPLLVLELANRVEDGQPSTSGYAPGLVLLFVLMWLSAFGFVAVFRALVRDAATGGYAAAHPGRVALRGVLLLVFAIAFLALLADQLGCFLGLPHCD